MAVKATCPNCHAVYNLAESTIGKKVRCKRCNEPFTVEDVLDVEEAEEQIQTGQSSRLRPPPARLRDDDADDFEDDLPPRPMPPNCDTWMYMVYGPRLPKPGMRVDALSVSSLPNSVQFSRTS